MTNDPRCGLAEASCNCIQPTGHDGPHVCVCKGSWTGTGVDFVPVLYPGGFVSALDSLAWVEANAGGDR